MALFNSCGWYIVLHNPRGIKRTEAEICTGSGKMCLQLNSCKCYRIIHFIADSKETASPLPGTVNPAHGNNRCPDHYFFFTRAQQPWWAKVSTLSRIHDHTQTHHTRQKSSGWVICPSQRPLPDNTQHSWETNVHATGGIQTTIPASERRQTHALDRAATGIGSEHYREHKSTLVIIHAPTFEVGGM